MSSLFTSHPASVGETYSQHFVSAMKFALAMIVGFVVCFVHALMPFLFEKTASRIVTHLYDVMVQHRHRLDPAVEAPPEPVNS